MVATRTRRSPEQARQLILEAAAELLGEGGMGAVQVRAVAARVGMTDAGVSHHFGNRDGLLTALLRHGGRQIRTAVDRVVRSWLDGDADLQQLVDSLAAVYRHGYGELAAALHAAGWRDRRGGILNSVVDALHDLRPDKDWVGIDDTRLAVAALHQALATESLYGAAFRHSAGLTGNRADNADAQLRWWSAQLRRSLGLAES